MKKICNYLYNTLKYKYLRMYKNAAKYLQCVYKMSHVFLLRNIKSFLININTGVVKLYNLKRSDH